MGRKPLTAVIVGAGHRAMTYASYAEKHPDELKIVGVADLIERRRKMAADRFGFPEAHNTVGGTARPSRAIHLLGTEGEIQGVLEDSTFTIRHIDPRPGHEYSEEVFDLNQSGDMHGAFGGHAGGDLRLVDDFVGFMKGDPVSISCTRIEDSVNGHLIAYCADRSVEERRVVEVRQA